MTHFMYLFFFCLPISTFAQITDTTGVHKLQDITVKANHSTLHLENGKLTANITGTELSHLGTTFDVLKHIPYLRVTDHEVQVTGKGKPLIYLDGHPVEDSRELETLSSEKLRNVQLILSPGSEYPAGTKAVILITTHPNVLNGLSGKASSNVLLKGRNCEEAMVDLSLKLGNWELFGNTLLEDGGSKNTDHGITQFCYNQNTYMLQSNEIKKGSYTNQAYKIGSNYSHKNFSAGIYYQYARMPFYFRNNGTENDLIAGILTSNIGKNIQLRSGQEWHEGQTYLDQTFKNNFHLHFDGTYLYTWYHENAFTETLYPLDSMQNERVPAISGRHSKLWAGKLYLEMPSTLGLFTVGTEDSYTQNDQSYQVNNPQVSSYIPPSDNSSRQSTYAVFSSYQKEFGKWSLGAGLRYEFVQFNYNLNGVRDNDVSHKSCQVFPNLTLSRKINEQISFSLSYRQYIQRPAYVNLRNSLLYVGAYELEGGNPKLRDCHCHELSTEFSWRDITLSAEYDNNHNACVCLKDHYEYCPEKIIFHPINANQQSLNVYGSFKPQIGIWNPSLSVGINKPWLYINNNSYDKAFLEYIFNNLINLPHHYMITADLSGQTSGNTFSQEIKATWGIDVGVRKQLIHQHLQLTLTATDIFNTRNQNWNLRYNDIVRHKISHGDSQSLNFTISYIFHPRPNSYKGKNAMENEQQRL